MPEPGWVIKFLRLNGEKLFVNLCEHAEVPSTPMDLRYSDISNAKIFLLSHSSLQFI